MNSGFPGANFSLTGIYFSHMLAYLLIVLLFCSPMQAGKNTMITSSRKMLLTNLTSSSWPWPNFGRNNRKRRLRNKTQRRDPGNRWVCRLQVAGQVESRGAGKKRDLEAPQWDKKLGK